MKHVLIAKVMEERTRRIVETAIALAERDGFEAVRLRDVASQANVALGTVYRRFKSKEDILVAALEHEVEKLQRLPTDLLGGANATERTANAFEVMTTWFVSKPSLARACLRAVASGVPEVATKVTRFHDNTTTAIMRVIQDSDATDGENADHTRFLAHTLQNIWFAELVGWAGGLHDEQKVIQDMRRAVQLLLSAPRPHP